LPVRGGGGSSAPAALPPLLAPHRPLPLPPRGGRPLHLLARSVRRLGPDALRRVRLRRAGLRAQPLRSTRPLRLRAVACLSDPRDLPARGRCPGLLGLLPAARSHDVDVDALR